MKTVSPATNPIKHVNPSSVKKKTDQQAKKLSHRPILTPNIIRLFYYSAIIFI